jgi:lysophospholipase L1-like esterase
MAWSAGQSTHPAPSDGRAVAGRLEISEIAGISIVDVDRLVAGQGAESLKIDGMHLNARGYELVSREVVRILSDIGIV